MCKIPATTCSVSKAPMLEIENKSYELASSVLEKSGIIDAEPAVFCMTQFESQEIPTLQPDEQGSVRQTLA